jgi:hypothetical protein
VVAQPPVWSLSIALPIGRAIGMNKFGEGEATLYSVYSKARDVMGRSISPIASENYMPIALMKGMPFICAAVTGRKTQPGLTKCLEPPPSPDRFGCASKQLNLG